MGHDRLAIAAGATLVALRLAPATLADDAAISFRYATRLAHGDGLTYNDHEQVLGISNPLYTLLLALADRLGLDPPTAARVLAVLAVVSVALLAHELARHRAGRRAGLLAAAAVLLAAPFVGLATSGLEAGLAAALGLGAFVALERERPGLAGVLAGLALVNKLDAVLLVVGLVVAERATRRRWPWRMVATAALVVLPVAVAGLVVYGTLLPHSLTAKLAGDATVSGYEHDPTWPLRVLGPAVGVLAVGALLGARRWRLGLGLLTWAALQVAAAAAVDLGGEYGWYLTVAVPPVAVGAVVAAATPTRHRPVAAALVALGLLGGLVSTVADALDRTDTGDLLERDRIAAGRWLDGHAPDGAVVDTCFGWVAYEALDLTVADRCGLTSEEEPGPVAYRVEAPAAGAEGCAPRDTPVATFAGAARADPDLPRLVVCRAMLPG